MIRFDLKEEITGQLSATNFSSACDSLFICHRDRKTMLWRASNSPFCGRELNKRAKKTEERKKKRKKQ